MGAGSGNSLDFLGLYGHSSYSGIHPVLWDSPLLCSEVVEDKSPKTDVVETYMKLIWVFNNHCQKPNRSRNIWMCWFGHFWVWIFGHFKALRRTVILTKPFKELLIFHVGLIWLSISWIPMVFAEIQDGLALKGFASKVTVPNYRVTRGADFSPQKWMFCPITCIKIKYLDFLWHHSNN